MCLDDFLVFFFKQKTAYEMRISDWSSDVCSSDLASANALDDVKSRNTLVCGTLGTSEPFSFQDPKTREVVGYEVDLCKEIANYLGVKLEEIGRASCRERVCQYV